MKKQLIALATILATLSSNLTYAEEAKKAPITTQKTTLPASSTSSNYPPIKPKEENTWTPWAFAVGMFVTAAVGITVIATNQGEKAYK